MYTKCVLSWEMLVSSDAITNKISDGFNEATKINGADTNIEKIYVINKINLDCVTLKRNPFRCFVMLHICCLCKNTII